MNGPGSMQKKFMDRAQLPGKTSKKPQISIPKSIYMKKMCSGGQKSRIDPAVDFLTRLIR